MTLCLRGINGTYFQSITKVTNKKTLITYDM